jgi:hypothetical protein
MRAYGGGSIWRGRRHQGNGQAWEFRGSGVRPGALTFARRPMFKLPVNPASRYPGMCRPKAVFPLLGPKAAGLMGVALALHHGSWLTFSSSSGSVGLVSPGSVQIDV